MAAVTAEDAMAQSMPMAVEVQAEASVEAATDRKADDSLMERLPGEVARVLDGLDLQNTTLGQVRAALETNLGLQSGALAEHKEYIGGILQEKIQQMQEENADDKETEATTPPPKEKDKRKKR